MVNTIHKVYKDRPYRITELLAYAQERILVHNSIPLTYWEKIITQFTYVLMYIQLEPCLQSIYFLLVNCYFSSLFIGQLLFSSSLIGQLLFSSRFIDQLLFFLSFYWSIAIFLFSHWSIAIFFSPLIGQLLFFSLFHWSVKRHADR